MAADPAPPFRDSGLIALTTRKPVAVTMVVLTVVIFGVISFERLPQNLMPDVSYPSITVRTEYPGASPIDVETRVSRRLEEVLSQVRNLRRVSSISRAEVSDVILEFAWNTNMGLATMDVREKVDQAMLPDGLKRPTILRYDPTLDPILQVGLLRRGSGGGVDASEGGLIELRVVAEDLIERELETVEGVAAVQVRGGLEREIRIEISETKLKEHGLSTALINQRLKDENLNQASGQLYEGEQAYVVRTVNEFEDIEEIGEIILRRQGDVPIRLRDVALVSWSYAEPEVLTRIDGHPCVKIEVYKEADANIVEVAGRVRNRLFGTGDERRRLEEILRKERELEADPEKRAKELQRLVAEAEARKPKGKAGGGRGGGPGPGSPGTQEKPSFLSSRLPPGDELKVMSDQSVFIKAALDDVRATAISGGILAILILYLFLRNAWFTLAVALSIPISITATFVSMYVCGVSLNLMSLGGLALGIGMLIDNSIVVLESIFRCRQEGDPPRAAAVRGTQEVAGAVISATLTTVAVFFPIVFVEGVAGQMFRDQAMTVVISITASLAVALYLIPVCTAYSGRWRAAPGGSLAGPKGLREGAWADLRTRLGGAAWRWPAVLRSAPRAGFLVVAFVVRCLLEILALVLVKALAWVVLLARALRPAGGGRLFGGVSRALDAWERGFEAFKRGYERLLRLSLARRGLVLTAVAVAVAISGRFLFLLGSELIPEVHQGEFTVDIRLPVGTRIEKTDRVLQPIEAKLFAAARELNVESLTTTIGVEKDSIKAGDEGEHTGKLLVRVKRGEDIVAAEERIKRRFRAILAAEAELSAHKFQHPVLFSFKTPIEVEVKGYNLQELKRITVEIEAAMRANSALKDVKSNIASGYPEVHLRFDRDILVRYQLSVASVGDVIRQKVQGDVPTFFNEGDRRIGLRVRLLEGDRKSLEDLAGIIVNPGAETPIRLSDIVVGNELTVSEGPAEIRRIQQQRAGVVTANVVGMDLGRLTEDVQGIIEGVQRPADFLVGFGGQKEEMDLSLASLTRALILAIFLVYVVMAMQFESIVQPLVILLTVPLMIVGVTPVLWAFGLSLSIVVLIGLIVLAGIVVDNAIVLLDCVNQLRARGLGLHEALVEGGMIRLRPILMTALTTVLGLLPMTGILRWVPGASALFGGEGTEVQAPMAITVIAGLSASTVLTLIIIPVVFTFVAGRDRKEPRTEDARDG